MSLEKRIEKAQTLVEALPYIKRFSGKTIVVKYGGSLISDGPLLEKLAEDIALLRFVGIKPIVVHGGGKEIDAWLAKFGKKRRMVDGQPFTDAETLEIIDMVLSGNVSSAIVTSLSRCGVFAVGLSGRDANLFTTRRVKSDRQKDLGYVGEVESTDVGLLHHLSSQNYVPVISSVGISRDGASLNVDSDLVAASIGSALKATKVIYLASSDGIFVNDKLVEMLDLPEAEQLLSTNSLAPGFNIKLTGAVQALKGGVTDVHIISGKTEHSVLLEVFTDTGIGTMITNQRMRI